MKGGTVTKIILEAIFTVAYCGAFSVEPADRCELMQISTLFETTCRRTYQNLSSLAQVIEAGGKSLSSGGRLVYLSEDINLSLLAVVDASECPPTFGADPNDVQAIFQHEDATIPPALSGGTQCRAGDTLVCLTLNNDAANLIQQWKGEATSVFVVSIVEGTISSEVREGTTEVQLPCLGTLPGWHNLAEISCKWILNAVSTGIVEGKCCSNRKVLTFLAVKFWEIG